MQARRIDAPNHLAQIAPHLAVRHGTQSTQHGLEQFGKRQRIAQAVGVGEGRTRGGLGADMIEPRLMAGHRRPDCAQRLRAGKLSVEQRDKLMPRFELAHQFIAPVPGHQGVEKCPRKQFEQIVEDGILVAHGVDPILCPDDS